MRKFRVILLWSGGSVSIKNTADPQCKKARQLHHSAKLRSNLMWNYAQLMCDQATQMIKLSGYVQVFWLPDVFP